LAHTDISVSIFSFFLSDLVVTAANSCK